MKKLLCLLLAVMPGVCMAQTLTKTAAHSYGGYMVNESGLTHNATYSLSIPAYDGKNVGVTVVYSSVNFSAATFTDGQTSLGSITVLSTTALSGVTFLIGNVTLTADSNFLVADTVNHTAANLAQIINASTCALHSLITATANSAEVDLVSVAIGGNYYLQSSNAAKLLASGNNMTGGTGAYYSADTDIINVPNHKFPLGLPVLYAQGAAIGGLTTQTTYYVIPIDANNIYLSSTSAYALAGIHNDITTQRAQATANTYTLTPLAIAGTPGFYWQGSNDGTNMFTVNIASVSITSYTSGGATVGFDFGDFNFSQLFLNITGPTTGAISLKANAYVRLP